MSILCYNISKVRSKLGTSVLTGVMVSAVAVHVVPEVITEDWEEGVVVFPESEAVLVVAKVVWLPVMPVEPLDGLIHMVPGPGARLVITVVPAGPSTHPEGSPLPHGDLGEHLRLQPVVDSRVVKLSNP